jgi:hypothetical protein
MFGRFRSNEPHLQEPASKLVKSITRSALRRGGVHKSGRKLFPRVSVVQSLAFIIK